MAKEKKDALTEVSDEKETKKAKKEKAEKSDKKDKKKDEKKSGGIGKWFADLKREFKMVTWPTKETVMINSGIVLGTIVISSLFVGLLDTGLLELMKFLLSLGQNS
ncbi:MAG: preprotein translocase subunit SecE [Oscillospiraceae bacterium]|nr:preprotein translocase subunit SecE [Oscillospiraceae bacterium]